ncbi:alpha/beta hydrolase [Streptomyces sp. BI20]|uniref:alpha/beta hydrolase n=1 Tax=Streptomyces sp. BI20 TaxID=3403460 RepID=UPI003C737501
MPAQDARPAAGDGAARLRVWPGTGDLSAACGAVLLLHGGRAEGWDPVPRASLPAARMRPFGRALARAGILAGAPVVVAEVRYRRRGWNGERADPARDAAGALTELAALAPGLPVVLVGHSMGARAGLRVLDRPGVRGLVALAPWWPPDEPIGRPTGRWVTALHDERDRVTDARATWAALERLGAAGARAVGVSMPRGRHAMLRDAGRWHRAAVTAAGAALGWWPEPTAWPGPARRFGPRRDGRIGA